MTPLNVTCGRFETVVARIAAVGGANGSSVSGLFASSKRRRPESDNGRFATWLVMAETAAAASWDWAVSPSSFSKPEAAR